MEAALKKPVILEPMPLLDLTFDNDLLPWHTACTVTGGDQRGVLQSVTAAFASVDVVVHSARVATQGSRVNDRFSITDRHGRKLDEALQERVRRALAGSRTRRLSR